MKKLSLFLLVLFIPLVFGFGAMSIMGSSDVVVETQAGYTEFGWSGADGQSWFGGGNLGSDLFDAGAGVFTTGTYAWTVYGSNTIANVGNALEITYDSDTRGAGLLLKDAADLSADLVVDQLYKVKLDASINTGSANIQVYDGVSISTDSGAITLSALRQFTIYFIAKSATDATLRAANMGAGEVLTYDNITIQAVTSPADYADSGAFVRVCSSGGTDAVNCATGYIGEAGSGETLGSELLTNPSFDVNTSGWGAGNSAQLDSVAGGVSNNSLRVTEGGSSNPSTTAVANTTANKKYKFSVWAKQGTESTYSFQVFVPGVYSDVGDGWEEATAVWDRRELYAVASSTTIQVFLYQIANEGSATTMFFDEASIKEVTGPNPNSVMIYKEPHLATEGWLTIGASFDPNDINTFTISQ